MSLFDIFDEFGFFSLGKEYFFAQVEAMRELVDISGKLAQKFAQPGIIFIFAQ